MKKTIEIRFTFNIKADRYALKFLKLLRWMSLPVQGLRYLRQGLKPLPKKRRLLYGLLAMLVSPLVIYGANLVKNYTFTSGNIISSSEVNANFDQLFETAAKANSNGNGVQFDGNVDAGGLTVNGQIVAQSSDTYWGNSGGNIFYTGGNVGIGEASPTSQLHVTGTTNLNGNTSITGTLNTTGVITGDGSGITNVTANSYAETDPQTGTNTSGYSPKWDGSQFVTGAVYQDASGNVGIGTANPAHTMHIVGKDVVLYSESSSFSNFIVKNFNSSSGAGLALDKASGTITSPGAMGNAKTLGSVTFRTYDSGASDKFSQVAKMKATTTQTHTSSFRGTKLTFWTTPNTAFGPSERMVIADNGNVGIGCTNPGSNFVIGNGADTDCATAPYVTINANDGDGVFTFSSSREYKKNIKPVSDENILKKVEKVTIVSYDWRKKYCKANDSSCNNKLGMIAEDFHTIFRRGSNKEINGGEQIIALWLSVQALIKENRALKKQMKENEVTAEAKNAQLDARLDRIERLMAKAN